MAFAPGIPAASDVDLNPEMGRAGRPIPRVSGIIVIFQLPARSRKSGATT
jgi:hypothetical protein